MSCRPERTRLRWMWEVLVLSHACQSGPCLLCLCSSSIRGGLKKVGLVVRGSDRLVVVDQLRQQLVTRSERVVVVACLPHVCWQGSTSETQLHGGDHGAQPSTYRLHCPRALRMPRFIHARTHARTDASNTHTPCENMQTSANTYSRHQC